MRSLSKAGWFCIGITLVTWGIVFTHYHGLEQPLLALERMLGVAFWGGFVLVGLFTLLMAMLFLSS